MRSMTTLGAVIALTALAACETPDFAAAMEDPDGVECRERGAALMSVAFEQTEAQPVGTDTFGTATYNVQAAGTNFRCTVTSDGAIVSFARG